MSLKVSFWMKAFRLLIAVAVALCVFPSIALAVDVNADKDVASGTTVTAQQKLNADGITLTNSGTIEYNGNTAVQTTTNKSGIKIINNAGGIIANTGGADKNYAIKGQLQTSLTIINSGTIESGAIYGIDIIKSTGTIITNNSGGIITAARQGIYGSNALTSNTTITNSGKIFVTDQKMAINFSSATGTTITNNAGGEIYHIVSDTSPVIQLGDDSSITNSGQIRNDSFSAEKSIKFAGDNSTLTNNSGGSITGYIMNSGNDGITVTNYGTISSSDNNGYTLGDHPVAGSTNTIVTNHAGGLILNTSTGDVVRLVTSGTLTNSGTIQNTNSTSNNAIRLDANNNTVILKDEGKVIGLITADSGTTGNTLQLDHGFGRAYFYETSGDFILEDLSGNTVVKGSAGSVGLGGQETVDELLGLRTYNLRSALKRYASAPKPTDEDTVWGEMFGYYSKRGGSSSLLEYDTQGYGMNFIHPVTSKLDFVLSVEKNELDLPENHDVSRTGFLAGFNASEFASFGNWKVSGFALAGMGWYDSSREILTNTQTTGLLDVTADYETTEVITGGHLSHTYQSQTSGSIKNTWETEMGLTMGYSRTADYNERHYFFWEERNLVQGSIHIGEQLTTNFNDRLRFTLGAELEHRAVLAGRKQTYRINHATVDFRHGSFYENSVAGNLGFNYSFINQKQHCDIYNEFCGGSLYIQLNSRLSDETRGTYGGGMGVRLNF